MGKKAINKKLTPKVPRVQEVFEHKMVAPGELSGAMFNPLSRTTPAALKALESDVLVNGILSEIHVIRTPHQLHKYMIVDGHRRWSIASMHNFDLVPIVIHQNPIEEAPDLWAILNRNTRSVNGLEWLVMWLRSGATCDKSLPPLVMSQIRRCIKIFGSQAALEKLVEAKIAPHVCERIEFIMRTFEDREESLIDRRRAGGAAARLPTKRQVGEWVVRHKAMVVLDQLKSIGRNGIRLSYLRKLLTRIHKDMPVKFSDLMSNSKVLAAVTPDPTA
jgi:ParB-like chromosome segregation protein Spo0J